MSTLDYIMRKWSLAPAVTMPIEIGNVGREDLATLFAELKFKTGVEVGTEQGIYAETLCRANPSVTLFCVDAWESYEGHRQNASQARHDGFYADTVQRLSGYNAHCIKGMSVETSERFADGSLDFVYIDANHDLPHVIADLAAWVPKVRRGGIVSGHDFCRRKGSGSAQMAVMEALYAWTHTYQIAPWFVLGRKDARAGEKRDRVRSWMWVK
jgi:predicted O-methyltransferase YrrM